MLEICFAKSQCIYLKRISINASLNLHLYECNSTYKILLKEVSLDVLRHK